MNTHKPARSDRVERVVRGLLGFVLLTAVVWALTNGSSIPQDVEQLSSLSGQ